MRQRCWESAGRYGMLMADQTDGEETRMMETSTMENKVTEATVEVASQGLQASSTDDVTRLGGLVPGD